MARDSQTVIPSSTRQGTLPVGENSSKCRLPPAISNGHRFSLKSISFIRNAIHGRNDQEEYFLFPMKSSIRAIYAIGTKRASIEIKISVFGTDSRG